jgi:hypothetical protein
MFQQTFTQKLLTCIVAGFFAACLIWVIRHIVNEAFYESNEGWKEIFKKKPSTQDTRRH